MAVELIEGLDSGGWQAGFLTQKEMERFGGLQNLTEWRRARPVLAVVDYAATSVERLRGWLEQLAVVVAGAGGQKLRLLMLEREASFEAGWLANVMARGHAASAVRARCFWPTPTAGGRLIS